MAQTHAGALKAAAKKAGMALDDYLAKLAGGERRCSRCKDWKIVADFGRDRTRHDGIDRACFACRRVKERKTTKGRPSPLKGRKMSDAACAKMSQQRTGRPNPKLRGRRRHIDTIIKISKSVRKNGVRGSAHHAYKDGKSAERKGERASAEYRHWRFDVMSRDGFLCQECGDDRGGNLQAHHIKSFADHPELRFDIANGVTLCWTCHDKKHAAQVSRLRRRRARGQLALPL